SEDWNLLGRINAFQDDWETAIQNFLRSGADDLRAIALKNAGKEREYLQLRRRFLDSAIARQDFASEFGPRPLLLLPVTGDDVNRVMPFADLAVPANVPAWLGPKIRLTKALAEYRVGRFAAAAASAMASMTQGIRSSDAAQSWFIQALAFG